LPSFKNVFSLKILLALLVCTSFLLLEFVASLLDNRTEGLTKRLLKDYELVRIVLDRNFKWGVFDNSNS